MILINKKKKYINLDNVHAWKIDDEDAKNIAFSFGDYEIIEDFESEREALKALDSIRQGLLKNLLFVKL